MALVLPGVTKREMLYSPSLVLEASLSELLRINRALHPLMHLRTDLDIRTDVQKPGGRW